MELIAVSLVFAVMFACMKLRCGPLVLLALTVVELRAACYMARRFCRDGWSGARSFRGEALRIARVNYL